MKKILMTLAAVLCCAMTTTVITACGSDDDDDIKPNEPEKKYVVNMYFDVSVGQGLFDFCDIYCTFTNVNGEVQTIKLPSSKGYYDKTADYDSAPENYEFSLYAVPKKDLPEIDTTAVYDFKFVYNLNYSVGVKDKPNEMLRTIMFEGPDKPGGIPVKGSKVRDYLEKYAEKLELVKKHTGTKS